MLKKLLVSSLLAVAFISSALADSPFISGGGRGGACTNCATVTGTPAVGDMLYGTSGTTFGLLTEASGALGWVVTWGATGPTWTFASGHVGNGQSGNYSIASTDLAKLVIANGSTAQTITLPSAVTAGSGWYFILEMAGTANQFSGTLANKTLTVTATSAQTIDGGAANGSIFTYPGDLRYIISDGANWITKLIRGGYVQINTGDSPATFTHPTSWTRAQAICYGGGGSGGGGIGGAAAGTNRSGGGGGGGGGRMDRAFSPSDLTVATSTVTVGAGATSVGTAGSGGNGGNGTNGIASTWVTNSITLLTVGRGGGGAGGGQTAATGGGGGGGGGITNGGNATTSTGGTAGTGIMWTSGAGGNGAASGGGGAAGAGGAGGDTAGASLRNGGTSNWAPAGGGGGGGCDTGATCSAGGAGGNSSDSASTTGGGGAGGAAAGTNAGTPGSNGDTTHGATGGGGGGANNGGTAGAGAAGGVPGGGGGGGGGGNTIGGAGGAGGAGACRFWYQP